MTREEAIRDIEECVIPYVGGISLGMAVEALKEQHLHGKWIEKTGMRPPEDKGVKFCSACMNRQPRDFITHKPIEPDFCPNCGADMRKRGEEK